MVDPMTVAYQFAKGGEELFKFLQTPMGQKVVERWLEDSAEAKRWLEGVGRFLVNKNPLQMVR